MSACASIYTLMTLRSIVKSEVSLIVITFNVCSMFFLIGLLGWSSCCHGTNARFFTWDLSPKYTLNGIMLKVSSEVRDLGVLVDAKLKFSPHVVAATQVAARKINFIMRSFELRKSDLYVKLFRIYVLPGLMYASPVWRPGLKKDCKLIERVFAKFRRKVEFRTRLARRSLRVVFAEETLSKRDSSYLDRILKSGRDSSKLLDIRMTNTRKGVQITPKTLALRKLVLDRFAWRVCSARNGYV